MTTTAPSFQSTHDRMTYIWKDSPGIAGFLTTVDHKRIGIRYFVTSLIFLVVGGIFALLMRTQLMQPMSGFLSPESFNRLMTMHGTTMIFLFNTPVWGGFGNYVMPLQIGTRDMAFPRMNALSYWIFLFSSLFFISGFLVSAIPDGGWFGYAPLTGRAFTPGLGNDFYAIGLAFVGLSTQVGGINFIVTIFKMRAPGMTASRIPIFTWGIVSTSLMIIFALPAITLAEVLLEVDRVFAFNIFNPAGGGDPILYQHFFWIWGHPEVYIVFIPAAAVVSQIIPVFARRPLAAYLFVVTALISIAFLSFGVWVHHMFAVGLGFLALSFFSAGSFMVSIPSGIQFFAWIMTIWKGKPDRPFPTPMLFCLGTLVVFLLGGVTGVMVAMVPFDFQVTDTYFVVAHMHYVLVGGSVLPIFAGLYFWLPKITGRMNSEFMGKISFWMIFIGFNLGFFPMHILGLMGMPRRIYTYLPGQGWDAMNLWATIGAYIMAAGFALSLYNFVVSKFRGRPAGPNPWRADSLEWATSSPPPTYNFLELPAVSSRMPLWDARHEEGAVEEPDHDRPVLLPPEGEKEHYTLATGGVDADVEAVMPMPPPTSWPLVLTVGITLVCYGTLVRFLPLAIVGVAVGAFALVGWFWPEGEEEEVHLIDEEGEALLR